MEAAIKAPKTEMVLIAEVTIFFDMADIIKSFGCRKVSFY
ncbi:hypothetical protein GQS_01585 [Thermococcus sp. 4557]|nr:hypothetical protein GQS_01585 [Thermococcus sp. 4557]